MAEYLIQDTTLTAIADAVRSKTGSTASLSPSEIATEIGNIKTGFPNGTEWTQSNINTAMCHVAYGDGIWVACSNGTGLYYSTDGMTWAQSNITSGIFYYSKYGNGTWVASSDSTGIYYSTDGMTWNQSNITDVHVNKYTSSGNVDKICFANNIWIFASESNGIYYSTDGMTWTQSNITDRNCNSCAYGNGIFVATGNGIQAVCISTDGITWTMKQVGTGCYSTRIVKYANKKFVITGSNGIYYSIDGITWTKSNLEMNAEILMFANGIWVAAAGTIGVYYSTDGMTWTQHTALSIGNMQAINNACGIWIISSSSSAYYFANENDECRVITSRGFYTIENANGIWVGGNSQGLSYSLTWAPT